MHEVRKYRAIELYSKKPRIVEIVKNTHDSLFSISLLDSHDNLYGWKQIKTSDFSLDLVEEEFGIEIL